MGTSNSYGGPGGSPSLLPAWALAPVEIPVQGGTAAKPPSLPVTNPQNPDPVKPDPAIPGVDPSAPPVAAPSNPQVIPLPNMGAWRPAKVAMSSFVTRGGSVRLRRAARRYVRARGGVTGATRAAARGRASTVGLGGFLSDVSTRGFAEAAGALGLTNLVGQSAETVLAMIANALAPDGATLEDAAARRATDETLAFLFERYSVATEGIEALNSLDMTGVRDALQVSVAGFIYQRWLQELGQRVEERAVTPQDAVKLERDIRSYVTEAVKLDLQGRDPLAVNWNDREGREIVERIYREAYSLLGT